MDIDYRKIDVAELLPHSGDMVLLDEILDYGDDFGVSRVTVAANCKFFEQNLNGIHCAIGLEWMAQTIAALMCHL